MRTHGQSIGRTVLLGAAAIALLAGCGQGQGARALDSSASDSAADEVTAGEVRQAFELFSVDFTEVSSEEQLDNLSDVIVEGELTDVATGRIEGAKSAEDEWADRNAAIAMTVTKSLKGQYEVGDTVWIELPVPPDRLGELEAGMPIAAHLQAAPESVPGYPFSDEGSEVPSSADLWVSAHPQGLTFEVQASSGQEEIEPLTGDFQD